MPHSLELYPEQEQKGEGSGRLKREAAQKSFRVQCELYGVPEPKNEFRFSDRKWAFDYAWPDRAVAVEQDGGRWVYGSHNRGTRFSSDMEKLNTAALLGWKVFRFTPQQIKKAEWVEWVKRALGLPTPEEDLPETP